LSGSSIITRPITTNTGATAGWPELRRLNAAAQLVLQSQTFRHIVVGNTATPYFRPQLRMNWDSPQTPRTDPALLRALARGHQWFGELAAGTATSTSQIAIREGVSNSYVRHLVPLALLAPAIVESICAERQGVCLSAERLKNLAGVPIEWDAQQRLLAD
jgi:hypothetical protein